MEQLVLICPMDISVYVLQDSQVSIVKQVINTCKTLTIIQWMHSISHHFLFSNFHLVSFYISSDIDDCISHSCQNGAVCVDETSGYRCECSPGFSGTFCESRKANFTSQVQWSSWVCLGCYRYVLFRMWLNSSKLPWIFPLFLGRLFDMVWCCLCFVSHLGMCQLTLSEWRCLHWLD